MLLNITQKLCRKCGVVKGVSEFHKSQKHDGLASHCKSCVREYGKQRYKKDSDKIKKKAKKWKEENKERYRQSLKDWHIKHPNYYTEYYHGEHLTQKRKTEEFKASKRQSNRINQSKRRARRKACKGDISVAEWNALIEQYDHTCLRCGRNDVKLTLDHVLPLVMGGEHSIENAQPLCKFCNSKKGVKHIDYRPAFDARKTLIAHL
jgi:5-methylcytosine-specific restriction endonuclease McrA